MKIGETIRKHRKLKHMTQEEMANCLGVTAPAVNKWENGNSYPDILLLSPIARLLEISLDDLLSFRRELSKEEIQNLIYEADRVFKEKTYEEGFEWAKKTLEEYPNCESLLLSMAAILWARLTKESSDSEAYENYIVHCFIRVLESREEDLRTRAADLLFGFYLRKEEYEKAEEYLAYFSEQNPEKKQKQALLYSKSGRMEEAYKLYEESLFFGYQRLNMVLWNLYLMAMEETDMERARSYVGKQQELARIFEMGEYHEVCCGLDLAVAEKNGEAVVEIAEKMISSIDSIYGFSNAPLYEHMSFKEVRNEVVEDLKRELMKGFEDRETFRFLRGNEKWERLLQKF